MTYPNGIEVKSEGALVISSPSLHASGRRYAWLDGLAPWEVEVAELPDSVVEGIRTHKSAPTPVTPRTDGVTANWVYSRAKTIKMVNNLLRWAIRRVGKYEPNREFRAMMAMNLGRQLGSLGLSDDEIGEVVALYSEAVDDE